MSGVWFGTNWGDTGSAGCRRSWSASAIKLIGKLRHHDRAMPHVERGIVEDRAMEERSR
jgi:hypothetical protein